MKNILRLIASAEILTVLFFFYAGYRTDEAMDKTGIGNLSQWTYWNKLSILLILILLVLWLCSFTITVLEKYQAGARGARIVLTKLNAVQSIAVAGPIVMMMLGYLILLGFYKKF